MTEGNTLPSTSTFCDPDAERAPEPKVVAEPDEWKDLSPQAKFIYEAIERRTQIKLRILRNGDSYQGVGANENYVHIIGKSCTFYYGSRKVFIDSDRNRTMMYGSRDKADLKKVEEGAHVLNLRDAINYLLNEEKYANRR